MRRRHILELPRQHAIHRRLIPLRKVPQHVPGQRIPKEEMIAAAMERWPQEVIEEALGTEAAGVLPEAIRLVELRARVPRYQPVGIPIWLPNLDLSRC